MMRYSRAVRKSLQFHDVPSTQKMQVRALAFKQRERIADQDSHVGFPVILCVALRPPFRRLTSARKQPHEVVEPDNKCDLATVFSTPQSHLHSTFGCCVPSATGRMTVSRPYRGASGVLNVLRLQEIA